MDAVILQYHGEDFKRGNEGKLVEATCTTSSGKVIEVLEKQALNPEDKERINKETLDLYQKLLDIKKGLPKAKRFPMVKHYRDESYNVYLRDLRKSKKHQVRIFDFFTDSPEEIEFLKNLENGDGFARIVKEIFRILAILHANYLVSGNFNGEMRHPIEASFLVRVDETNTPKVFLSDIHNLADIGESERKTNFSTYRYDIESLMKSLDEVFDKAHITFIGKKVYGETLRELNPELYGTMHTYLNGTDIFPRR